MINGKQNRWSVNKIFQFECGSRHIHDTSWKSYVSGVSTRRQRINCFDLLVCLVYMCVSVVIVVVVVFGRFFVVSFLVRMCLLSVGWFIIWKWITHKMSISRIHATWQTNEEKKTQFNSDGTKWKGEQMILSLPYMPHRNDEIIFNELLQFSRWCCKMTMNKWISMHQIWSTKK